MRLTQSQQKTIKALSAEIFGPSAEVIVFGSRVDEAQRGGDIDLMITTKEPVERPTIMAARLSARISQALDGRQLDVVLKAPSLKQQVIHEVAEHTGVRL
ncbi:MAG: nucleotidyltransferase domain-containing protein [Halomonadaceae bacterium]|nr:MAG: nucleotidyltransferase domain-containing protein [Halomonadaceae bacterium]